jgi:hypothetical protein
MEEAMKKLDFIRSAHKSCSYDQGNLQKEKDSLEKDNLKIRQALDKMNSLKELNIQIDILKTSPSGIDIMREKYAKLLGRMQLERIVYQDLEEEYFNVKHKIDSKKKVEDEIKVIKEASEQQDFHIKRYEDIMPLVKQHKSAITSQECIIQNLQKIIKDGIRNADLVGNKETDLQLQRMKHDHEMLKEKNKQFKVLYEIHEGQLPMEIWDKVKKDDFIRDNPKEVGFYKKKSAALLKEVETISREMSDLEIKYEVNRNYQDKQRNDPTKKFDKDLIVYQIEALEGKAESMEKEIITTTKIQAATLSELKQKIIQLDSLLAAKKYI